MPGDMHSCQPILPALCHTTLFCNTVGKSGLLPLDEVFAIVMLFMTWHMSFALINLHHTIRKQKFSLQLFIQNPDMSDSLTKLFSDWKKRIYDYAISVQVINFVFSGRRYSLTPSVMQWHKFSVGLYKI